ncbi:MAG: Phosphoglycolate phosphatase [Verrucomicrobiae bacterium]|nr:Phosphoglycolate phosphatase [Verrucomicrobiae bacterium]
MIRAVFFDIGGTLIRPWPSVGAVYARVGREFGLPATAAGMEAAFRAAWKAGKTNGGLTTSDANWWRGLVAQALELQSLANPPGYFDALYAAFVTAEAWQIFPGVIETLELQRARGRHVGVISNWDDRLRPLLKNLGLDRYFDSVTISCEVGAEKPDARVFQAALRVAGVTAAEALHVGDSEVDDVLGAQAVGMTARLVVGGDVRQATSCG